MKCWLKPVFFNLTSFSQDFIEHLKCLFTHFVERKVLPHSTPALLGWERDELVTYPYLLYCCLCSSCLSSLLASTATTAYSTHTRVRERSKSKLERPLSIDSLTLDNVLCLSVFKFFLWLLQIVLFLCFCHSDRFVFGKNAFIYPWHSVRFF